LFAIEALFLAIQADKDCILDEVVILEM